MRVHDFFENKIKGADGKACWDGYRYNGTKDGKDSCVKVTKEEVIDEARADVNFDAEDLKRLERISDLETLKTQAFGLISKPSAKPMKPEKVAWFKQALAGKSNKIAVIKMMYDLMLSGEGNSVIGSKNSMNPNSYRKVFNSATSEGVTENAEELGIGDDVIISGNVEFNGKTGVIDSFGQDKRFVVVNLYNHGKHSFHSSDVSVNDYADSDEEQARMSEAYQNDEANLWYIYDTKDGRLKQKMVDNLDEPKARGMGYRDSIDSALRVANIIRSKFDAKKFVQKQGNQWVPVYPFGQQGVAEAKSLSKKVKIVKGTHAGKIGWIREIKHGAFKGAPKTYYIDLDGGGQADNLPATALRLVKDMDEAIKGWKNAASDIRKVRSAASDAKKSAVLVSLKKDGNESGMHDAKSYYASEEEARNKHDSITKLNPTRKIRHNLYVDNKKVATLGEAANPAQQAAIAIAKKKQDAKEAFASPPPFKDMIASIYQPKVGDSIRTRKGGQIPGTVEKVADYNGIEYCWFRHPEGKLYKTPCSNVMRG